MWSNWIKNFWFNFTASPGTTLTGLAGLWNVVHTIGSFSALAAMPVNMAVGIITQMATSIILMGSKGPDFTAGSAVAQTAATAPKA